MILPQRINLTDHWELGVNKIEENLQYLIENQVKFSRKELLEGLQIILRNMKDTRPNKGSQL